MANRVSVSASVLAEATPRQVRLRSTSYDGTRQPNILKRPLTQTISIWITKAGFVVKINLLHRDCNFRPVWSASGGFALGWLLFYHWKPGPVGQVRDNRLCHEWMPWNNGILEYWNTGFSGMRSIYIHTARIRGKIRHHPLFIPNIPSFHHSIIPSVLNGKQHPSGVKSKPGPPSQDSLLKRGFHRLTCREPWYLVCWFGKHSWFWTGSRQIGICLGNRQPLAVRAFDILTLIKINEK